MVLDAESVIDRRRLKRRLTAWRIAAVALGLLLLGALLAERPEHGRLRAASCPTSPA